MHPDDRTRATTVLVAGLPIVAWLAAAVATGEIGHGGLGRILRLARATATGERPLLLAVFVSGLGVALAGVVVARRLAAAGFGGANFRLHVRGTRVVSAISLAWSTRERRHQQITVAGVPMPTSIETLHLLVGGSTGSGKSVLIREMAYTALLRGDRIVVADPNGDMLAKFHRPGDVILNPYDSRGLGWTFFNEIRAEYDFKRFALSLVPRGQTKEEEEWCAYARLLLRETARKLSLVGQPSVAELFRWTTIAKPADLQAFLAQTAAESLFVGADKALASARFVLSAKLPEHLSMPAGEFSLRTWLADPAGGNLFITWREDMAEALKPLISAWVDVLCTSILSLDEDRERRIWMFLDELASLEKLPSLEDAATKGRKAGLRIVAGLQSTAQLERIYGREEAQTLRSCFRSLVVLGGAKTDPRTCEDLSQSLGEHEVERESFSRTTGPRGDTTSSQIQRARERVVLASEIASLPDLTGYLAFAGDHPIAKVKLDVVRFRNRVPAFEERLAC
ncbi:type IV secretion system DNA-binding domain-containing protein [Anaeromyxobacter sp. PSR-1]|uniref:type IV secretion system DNA-binding domain-containing protein n=1 Tax=Anaeromyxobacter sp. PSR-1 TaxID=1300915 RepID=UPI0005E9B5B2|nr:type IV secretion system DNA-binding domain-containing protein [Anaeromyxobacter sp. PSR-1]GAO01309.1 coupling protein TraD [Anaeromyxobacter sp. PSR-1]